MSSLGPRRSLCGHLMRVYDSYSVCAHIRDKKGSDPYVEDKVYPDCDILTEEQKIKLATPSYQKKEGKQELKNLAEKLSSSLRDFFLVSVKWVAKDSGVKSSDEVSTTPVGTKEKKKDKGLEVMSSTPEVAKTKKMQKTPDSKVAEKKSSKKRHSSPVRSSTLTTDSKLEAMDLTWSERFNRLEAMLLSKSFSQPKLSFQLIKITPVKPTPAGTVDNLEPFFAPTRSTD